jgi:hypothetical protein
VFTARYVLPTQCITARYELNIHVQQILMLVFKSLTVFKEQQRLTITN